MVDACSAQSLVIMYANNRNWIIVFLPRMSIIYSGGDGDGSCIILSTHPHTGCARIQLLHSSHLSTPIRDHCPPWPNSRRQFVFTDTPGMTESYQVTLSSHLPVITRTRQDNSKQQKQSEKRTSSHKIPKFTYSQVLWSFIWWQRQPWDRTR